MVVTFLLRLDAGLTPGGGEVQAANTAAALERLGVTVKYHHPLDGDLGDVLHTFGCYGYFWETARHAKSRGIPIVCSPIFMSYHGGARLKWRSMKRNLRGKRPSEMIELLRSAHALLTLTSVEEERMQTFYGTELAPFVRVPNGVESRFAEGDPALFRERFEISDSFILCASSLHKTKNQLRLVEAVKALNLPLVIVGREEDAEYVAQVKNAAGSNVRFLGPIAHDDPLLSSAYAACRVFAMPTLNEVFSIAAMEATIAGKPLVVGDTWGAQEIFGPHAYYVDPRSVPAIRVAVQSAWNDGQDRTAFAHQFRQEYSWDTVARKILTVYESALRAKA